MLLQRFAKLGVLLVMLPGYALSQESRPKFQIAAEVSDVSGAVLAGATVRIHAISASTEIRGTTNEVGKFLIQLEGGKYTFSIMELGFKALTQQVEVTGVEDQRFSFVLEIDPRYSGYQGPCCFEAMLETEMSRLPDRLVLPPSPVVPPLKPPTLRRNAIARFFSAIM